MVEGKYFPSLHKMLHFEYGYVFISTGSLPRGRDRKLPPPIPSIYTGTKSRHTDGAALQSEYVIVQNLPRVNHVRTKIPEINRHKY